MAPAGAGKVVFCSGAFSATHAPAVVEFCEPCRGNPLREADSAPEDAALLPARIGKQFYHHQLQSEANAST